MIKEALAAKAKASRRVFVHDRSTTVGGSDVGQCARKIAYTKHWPHLQDGFYFDTWGAQIRGTLFEDHFWAPAMRLAFKSRLKFAGKAQKTLVSGLLSSTPDGLLTSMPRDTLKHLGIADIESDCLLIECKTIDPRANIDLVKPEHAYQTQVQLGLMRETTKYKPVYALISYTNASFMDEVTEFAVKFDPEVYAAAKKRATMIMTASKPTELRPEGWIAGGKECGFCPFTKACGIERTNVPAFDEGENLDPQFVAEIVDLAHEERSLSADVDLHKIAIRKIQDEIKDRLREKNVRRVKANGVSVVWSQVKGKVSWDNDAIREALAHDGYDLEQFKSTGEPTDRLVITVSTLESTE
jgi:hypothetical protein